jgi:hypothetical protein
MRFGLPHHPKCHQNIANSAPHDTNQLGTCTIALWTFVMMELILLFMEEMEKLMQPMTTVL